MREVADSVPVLSGVALERAEAALLLRKAPENFDVAAARAMFQRIVAGERVTLS
jgi:beta-N-acetylhexosaminidase